MDAVHIHGAHGYLVFEPYDFYSHKKGRYIMSRFRVLCFVVLGLMVFTGSQAWADSNCIHLSAQGQATPINPANPFDVHKGTIVLSVDGQPPVQAELTVVPQNIRPGEDGTMHVTNAVTITLPDGSTLNMADHVVLSPTEVPMVYRLNSRLDNFNGTGMFENAFGRLIAHGTKTFTSIDATVFGKICWMEAINQ